MDFKLLHSWCDKILKSVFGWLKFPATERNYHTLCSVYLKKEKYCGNQISCQVTREKMLFKVVNMRAGSWCTEGPGNKSELPSPWLQSPRSSALILGKNGANKDI